MRIRLRNAFISRLLLNSSLIPVFVDERNVRRFLQAEVNIRAPRDSNINLLEEARDHLKTYESRSDFVRINTGILLGRVMYKLGENMQSVEKVFRRAMMDDRMKIESFQHLASCWETEGEIRLAIQYYKEAKNIYRPDTTIKKPHLAWNKLKYLRQSASPRRGYQIPQRRYSRYN